MFAIRLIGKAEDEVDPRMEVGGDVLAFQRFPMPALDGPTSRLEIKD